MYQVDEKKWYEFLPEVQLKNIAAELSRVTQGGLYESESKKKQVVAAYERALILIGASLEDPQWKDKEFLYQLRDAVAAMYVGKADPAISRLLSAQLLSNV